MKTAFVDTSGFYALLDGSDPFHARAKEAFLLMERENWLALTTSYVVHESWALIQARLGWEAVEAWLQHVLPHCEIIWVGEEQHKLGAARCRQARQRRLSLTDCVSIEVMREHGLRHAVADDEHFTQEGFTLPAAAESKKPGA